MTELTDTEKANAIARIENAIKAANDPSLSRRERRARCRALAKRLGAPIERIMLPIVDAAGFTSVASQIAHHRRKAGLVEPTSKESHADNDA